MLISYDTGVPWELSSRWRSNNGGCIGNFSVFHSYSKIKPLRHSSLAASRVAHQDGTRKQ
jgi:hypothetical protein